MGKHSEDKHCGFTAVGEAYLMCSYWQDNWTLTASFRGVRVPGLAEVQWKPSVCWSLLQSRVSPLNPAGFGAGRASRFKSRCRAGSQSFGLARSFLGLFLLRELNHPCNCRSQDSSLWALFLSAFMLSAPKSCLLVPLDLWFTG